MVIDITTHEIYDHAPRDHINSWLRTLAAIRRSPERWPTRWPPDRGSEEA